MAQGSGGYGGPNFSATENSLRNIAVSFAAIVQLQQQLAASVQTWRALEKEITLANAAAGGTSAEFTKMEQASRNFAMASTFSASQVANAFYSLASAGMTVTETLSAATGVILLSQATLTDLGEASDVVSSSLQQFNMQSAEAYRISNLFVASTNSSLSTVPKLAFALRQVGPIAAQMGLDIETTTAALDTLFDVGLRGEQAGTALRNSLVRIMNPVGEGAKMLQNLGLETIDQTTGKMRPFIEIMKELAGLKLAPDSIVQIFGTEAAAGATALLASLRQEVGKTTTAFERHKQEISGTDAAYRQAMQQMNTLNGTLSLLSNNFNEFRIEIGQALTPVIGMLAEEFGSLTITMQALTSEQKLGYVQTALQILQYVMLAKFAAGLVGGIASAAKGMQAYNLMTARMITENNGAAMSMGQMARRATSLGRVLMGIGSAAVGLAAVGFAIYTIKKGMDEAAASAAKLRRANVTGNILDQIAETEGMSGARRERFTDVSDPSGAVAKRLSELNKLAPVDANTGKGATQRARMQLELMRTAQADLINMQGQLGRLRAQAEPLRKELAEFGEIAADIYDTTWAETITRRTNLNVGLVQFADSPLKELSVQLQEIVSFENKTIPEVRKHIQAMVDRRRQLIPTLDSTSAADISSMKANTDKLEQLGKRGADVAVREFQQSMVAVREYATDQFRGATDRASASEAAENVYTQLSENITTNMILTPDQMEQLIAERQTAFNSLRATIQSAAQQNKEINALITTEIVDFVVQTSGINPQDQAKLQQFLATPQGQQILQQATADATKVGGGMSLAGKNLINAVISARQDLAKVLGSGVEAIRAIALLDRQKIDAAIRENEVEYLEIQQKMAKLAGDPETFERLTRQLINERRNKVQSGLGAEFLTALEGKDDDATRAAITRLQNMAGGPDQLMAWLNNRLASAAAGNEESVRNIMHNITQAFRNDVNNVDALLEQYRTEYRNAGATARLETQEMEEDLRKEREADQQELDRRREQAAEDYAQMLEGLLALPTNEEIMLEVQGIRAGIRERFNSYYQLTLPPIIDEMNAAELALRQNLQDLQNDYSNMFTSDLAEGLDSVINNRELMEAFNGTALQKIRSQGSAMVLGREFTREMVASAEGINAFIRHVTGQFQNAVNNDPNATGGPERVAAFARQMRLMVEQTGAQYEELAASLALAADKYARAERDISEFKDQFDNEKIIRDFENALALTGPETTSKEIEVLIDVAVKAKTTRVILDAEDAKKQLREKYEQLFRNMGVATTVDAKGMIQQMTGVPITSGIASATGRAASPAATAQQRAANFNPMVREQLATTVAAAVAEVYRNPLADARHTRTGAYGERRGNRSHRGVDDAAAFGTRVGAPLTASVVSAGWRGAFGKAVELEYSNGIREIFGHLSSIAVTAGTRIAQGAKLGEIGSTGRSTGNHLHRQTYDRNGNLLNPDSMYGRNVRSNPAAAGMDAEVIRTTDAGRAAVLGMEKEFVRVTEHGKQLTKEEIASRQQAFDNAIANYQKEYAEIDRIAQLTIGFIANVDNARAFAMQAIRETRERQFDEIYGVPGEERIYQATRGANNAIDANRVARDRFTSGGGGDLGQANSFALAARQAELLQQREEQLQAVRRDAFVNTEDRKALEDEILANYERQTEQLSQNVLLQREMLENNAAMLEELANQGGGYQETDILLGMRAAVLDFAASVPTAFETMRQAAGQALSGVAELGAALFTGAETNAKQAIAGILRGLAQLMAKMVIMWAFMQMIRAIPGGAALLSAMDLGVGIGGSALSSGVANVQSQGSTLVGAPAGLFADGGVMSPYGRRRGGVRNARQPAMSIFGEGDHPEAYIPMLDHKSIPVRIDDNGDAYIPLPSGEHIPVTFDGDRVKKFAMGGRNGRYQKERVRIPYDPVRAKFADQAMATAPEAVAPWRSAGASTSTVTNTNHYDLKIPVTIQGNASAEDGDAIAREVAKQVMAMMDAREAESRRREAKNSHTIQASYL